MRLFRATALTAMAALASMFAPTHALAQDEVIPVEVIQTKKGFS